MKTVIVYDTKSGTTEDCAKELEKKLKGEVINLKSKNKIDLNNYDTVIIGTPIYAGQINGKVKSFCISNEDKLKEKNIYFYTCGISDDNEALNSLSNGIPKSLIEKSNISHFGGELRPDKQGLFLRFIVKQMLKNSKVENKINSSKINDFANKISTCK